MPTSPRRPGACRLVTVAATAALLVIGATGCTSDDEDTADTTAPAASAEGPVSTTAAPDSPIPDSSPVDSAPAIIDDLWADGTEAMDELFSAVGPDDPGCTAAVAIDGEVVYAEAFGAARLDPTEPMTTETIVDIGSTSKQFTATALLLAEQDGLVDLDDVLSDHVAGLPEWADRVTLRQMMHHTSGIPDYIELLVGEGFEFTDPSTDADAMAALADVTELDFEPDTGWDYSNSNYFLISQVVLEATGTPLDEYLAAEVFEPLGLEMVMDPTAALPGKALSYEGSGADRVVADSKWEQLGDGAIQTTPTELVRWASQYWSPTIGAPEILPDRLDGVEIPEEGDRYGAGIIVIDDPELGTVLSHSGGWGGFETLFVVAPDERVAVAATCTSPETTALLEGDGELDFLEPWLA